MIKFENTEVMNLKGAIRGMRNPLNSWEKSDSVFYEKECESDCPGCKGCVVVDHMCIKLGENDLDLARRLIKAGSDHRKFLRQIFVSVDITAPLYWWKEFDTYKVATVANSCSTMHTIHKKKFTLDDFSHEHLSGGSYQALVFTIKALNDARSNYLELKNKAFWWNMIQLLPSSYNQKRTVTLNYETLRNIYGSRRGHKLNEWSTGFMKWIESLPYAEYLIMS